MSKKITFVAHSTTGEISEEMEFEDCETELDIKERFFDWICESCGGYWYGEGEE